MKRAGAADIVAPQPRESIEYVGGPWNGETEMRLDLPSEIPTPDGIYSRSVRCVDDGAMRYVWRAGGRRKWTEAAEMADRKLSPGDWCHSSGGTEP